MPGRRAAAHRITARSADAARLGRAAEPNPSSADFHRLANAEVGELAAAYLAGTKNLTPPEGVSLRKAQAFRQARRDVLALVRPAAEAV